MPILNMQNGEYIPIPPTVGPRILLNQNTFNDLVGFYEIMTGNKYPFQTDPVQLHFQFYNELHHRPNRKKKYTPMSGYVCPF